MLPVEVPSFERVSRDALFVGYRLIRGRPLVDEDPEDVRAFLDALHAFDASACVRPLAGMFVAAKWPNGWAACDLIPKL